MFRSLAMTAIVTLLAAAPLVRPAGSQASKVKEAISPGSITTYVASRSRVLASHGEWGLAWEALQTESGRASAELAVTVLTRLRRYAAAESVLTVRLHADDDKDDFFRQLQLARLQLQAGEVERALERLASIDALADPVYGAYRDLVLAQARLAAGDAPGAASAVERALRSGSPAAVHPAIDDVRIDALLALGRAPDALAAARDAVADARDADTRARMLRRSYDVAAESGDRVEASRVARVLFDEHRRSRDALECATEFVKRATAAQAEPAVMLSCASVFQANGRSAELRRTLRLLDARELTAAELELQRLLWGEYHFMSGDFSRAIALARPSYADDELRRRSMLLLARSFRAVARPADAAGVYVAFAVAFPNDPLAAEALYTAASLYADAGKVREADRLLDDVRRSYPSTFYGWAAALERANVLERDGRAEEAAAIYEQWLARSRRTDEAALFYLARTRANSGAQAEPRMLLDELAAVNPYSFYTRPDVGGGALAPRATAGDAERRDALSDWLAGTEARREQAYRRVLAAAKRGSDADGDTEPALVRARRFLEAGFDDWAQNELEVALRDGLDGATEALRLARLFDENAMPWRSVRLYERARAGMSWEDRREHADDFRLLTYPIPYPAQVFEASFANDLAPHLLYGLIREESHFESEAVSRAGAVGLMQLMPATASRIAAQMDLPWEGVEELGSPDVNVAIGAWYAADLLRDGRGSVAWMLAAYNAGPGAAKRWIEPGTVGEAAIDAVESIDYRETRGYVKRVVESANVYHDLYFGGGRATGAHR
jgi:peptidoglycan lytic transglycosylase